MLLFNLLIFLLTLNEVIVDSDANTCKIGEKVMELQRGRTQCVPCEEKTFQDKPTWSQSCRTCRTCDEANWTYVQEKCTKVKDTICGCRKGFSFTREDSVVCQCDIGSGLENGVCSKCKDGYFSTVPNSSCQKWKDCKSAGIKKAGTATSDVICNENLNGSKTTASSASIKKVFLSLSTTRRPHEGVQTQKKLSTTTTTPVQHTTVSKNSSPSSNVSSHIGTTILILGIVGLLVLTAMTCKLHITPCWHPKPALQTKDSLCRRPVEESGDGSEASLKLNPEP